MTIRKKMEKMYRLMEGRFGDLKWWPADTMFEVIIGAVLTQNTSWHNVEIAVGGLKKNGLLTPEAILDVRTPRLARIIKSSGYHRVKARRLKETAAFIMKESGGDLEEFRLKNTSVLRKDLLGVNGIGPETADSILLYAFGKPVFVVDAYTKRIFSRHGIIEESASYPEVQELVHGNFPRKMKALNQLHALIVETGKRFCGKRKMDCGMCPLNKLEGDNERS